MFTYERRIRIQDTDASGCIYFANQLQIGLEAFEDFLYSKGCSLQDEMEKRDFLFPIVHAEADFFAQIFLGDLLCLRLTFPNVGTSSFTHASEVFVEEKKVGFVKIVHVMYCPIEKKKIPIPNDFRYKILKVDATL